MYYETVKIIKDAFFLEIRKVAPTNEYNKCTYLCFQITETHEFWETIIFYQFSQNSHNINFNLEFLEKDQ